MVEHVKTETNDHSDRPSFLRRSGGRALIGFGDLFKYIIYGWVARIILILWIAGAGIPAIIAGEVAGPAGAIVVGIIAFCGIGLTYGAVKEYRQEESQ